MRTTLRWLWLAWRVARRSCGTTSPGMSWPPASSGSPAMPARSPSFRRAHLPRRRARNAGEFAAAAALIDEADAIAAATGNAPLRYASLVLAAWRGQEAQALALIEAGVRGRDRQG